jgi:hypothetical protein
VKAIWLALLSTACVSGGVSTAVKDDLKRAVGVAQGPITLCYEQALQKNAALEGEIVLSFAIPSGAKEATDVSVSKKTIEEPSLEQCLVQEAKEISLSVEPEAKLAVTYPIRFSRKSVVVE